MGAHIPSGSVYYKWERLDEPTHIDVRTEFAHGVLAFQVGPREFDELLAVVDELVGDMLDHGSGQIQELDGERLLIPEVQK